MSEKNIALALNQALMQSMEKDATVVMIGEDIGKDGGVFRVTDGLLDKFGDKRVMDSVLAEGVIVGAGLGMAVNGLKPVIEIQFSGFIYPAVQEIISHVARMRNRTRGMFTSHLVIRTPNGGGVNALEHHSESMEAMWSHIPGIKVVTPATPYDAKGLMIAAINDPDPVIFLEPIKLYRAFKQEVPDDYYEVPLGKARVAKEGKDLTIVAWGAMVPLAEDAASQVKFSCEIIDLRTISPWDKAAVLASVKKTGRCVIVHEAVKTCGFAAEIAATLQEEAMLSLKAPVGRITSPDIIVPLYRAEHFYRPNSDMLIKKLNEVMSF